MILSFHSSLGSYRAGKNNCTEYLVTNFIREKNILNFVHTIQFLHSQEGDNGGSNVCANNRKFIGLDACKGNAACADDQDSAPEETVVVKGQSCIGDESCRCVIP